MPPGSRQHVLHETLVPGDVHEAQSELPRLGEKSEAQVYSDPSLFFFFEPIRIGPGERLYQSALPVIDVPRRSHDDVLHAVHLRQEKFLFLRPLPFQHSGKGLGGQGASARLAGLQVESVAGSKKVESPPPSRAGAGCRRWPL